MIVLDASVVVELLIQGVRSNAIRKELISHRETLIVPHLLDVEAISALRRIAAVQRIDSYRCRKILADLAALPAERYPHAPLMGRIWELRHNFTAYDAAYIALAEATGSILYTCDEKLRAGHGASVLLFR